MTVDNVLPMVAAFGVTPCVNPSIDAFHCWTHDSDWPAGMRLCDRAREVLLLAVAAKVAEVAP